MPDSAIITHRLDTCRAYLEQHALDLREQAPGLQSLATHRQAMVNFAYEALESGQVVLAQLDPNLVYAFVPSVLADHGGTGDMFEQAQDLAISMLDPQGPVMGLELLAAEGADPPLAEQGRIEGWMTPEFLDGVVLEGRVRIVLFFDGESVFRESLTPQLDKRGYELLNDYDDAASRGVMRVRHPSVPGRVFRVPWVQWVREMLCGGYNLVYMMACFAVYLQKMQESLPGEA